MNVNIEIEIYIGKYTSQHYTLIMHKGIDIQRIKIDETIATQIITMFMLQYHAPNLNDAFPITIYK